MIYEEYVKTNKVAFLAKLENISNLLRINPEWLMLVMYAESRLNPQAVNKQNGDPSDPYTRAAMRATGLIQFMPSTARGLGTTTQQIYMMTNVQQLDWVYKYYKPYAGRIKSVHDLYMVTFFPVALGKPDSFILQSGKLTKEIVASQNKGIDLNKDKQITVGEFKAYVDQFKLKKK